MLSREENLVLIGMPGAGKSTIGVLLAKTLGRPFLDTDLLIQHRQQQLLQQIIDQQGLEAFLRIEAAAIRSLGIRGHVIATGGSVVYSSAAMIRLQQHGRLVYLEIGLAEMQRRLQNIATRGLVIHQGQSLPELFAERLPLYRRYAKISVSCDGKGPEQVVETVLKSL